MIENEKSLTDEETQRLFDRKLPKPPDQPMPPGMQERLTPKVLERVALIAKLREKLGREPSPEEIDAAVDNK